MASAPSTVIATVHALVCEFGLAYARDVDGFQYAITPDSAGTPWNELREGQQVRLEVSPAPARTLSVQVLP